MKKFFIICILLGIAQSTMAQIVTNSGLERLERKILKQTYSNENYQKRIERLEQKMFGALQSGDTDERYKTLRSAAQNYKNYNPYYSEYYNNQDTCRAYPPPVFTYGQGSDWRRTMWNNFRNYSGIGAGMPTGITPAMDPAYMDWFEADRAARQEYYKSNHGYSKYKTNSATGTGVTILD